MLIFLFCMVMVLFYIILSLQIHKGCVYVSGSLYRVPIGVHIVSWNQISCLFEAYWGYLVAVTYLFVALILTLRMLLLLIMRMVFLCFANVNRYRIILYVLQWKKTVCQMETIPFHIEKFQSKDSDKQLKQPNGLQYCTNKVNENDIYEGDSIYYWQISIYPGRVWLKNLAVTK